ncbi:MAG: DUF6293 family protein [Promethearchaeota archaeon]
MEDTVVHIIPLGLAFDRIIEGLKWHPGNKVHFIMGTKKTQVELTARKILEKIKEKISMLYEIEEEYVNVHDFNDILRKTSEIMRKEREKGSTIFVNISSGTKVVIVALAIAAFLYDAQLYYVVPEEYTALVDKIPTNGTTAKEITDDEIMRYTTSSGARSVIRIPPLPIRLPGDEELKILEILSENPASSLKEIATKANFGEDKKSIAKVSYYIRKLEDDNLIEIERSKRRMKMQITVKGKILISALKS